MASNSATPSSPLARLYLGIDSFLFGVSVIFITSGILGLFFVLQERALEKSQDLRSQAQEVSEPSNLPAPPEGCYYEIVECVTTPCDPMLVCEQPPVCSENPDRNSDNIVDLLDYSMLSSEFLHDLDTYTADINCDGRVDLLDYSILSRNFSLVE